ncbi:MAG: hypothetical protein PHF67_00180 [Candidatus Nanoarchaeia archaeon]|nr:hypothetical protein [Candidatus Nanoarchaeia archaeon]
MGLPSFSSGLLERRKVVYEVTARELDKHYLLEERFGSTQRDRWKVYGISDHRNAADRESTDQRLLKRTREVADSAMEEVKRRQRLELVDLTVKRED